MAIGFKGLISLKWDRKNDSATIDPEKLTALVEVYDYYNAMDKT